MCIRADEAHAQPIVDCVEAMIMRDGKLTPRWGQPDGAVVSVAACAYRRLAALVIIWPWACSSKPSPPPSTALIEAGRPALATAAPDPAPQPTQAPGVTEPCIEDMREHAVRKARALREREGQDPPQASFLSNHSLPDVDGDGRPEQLIVDEYLGTATNAHFLYLSNRGCRRDGGTIRAHADSIRPLPQVIDGFRTLQAFASDGCAGREGTVSHLAWTGDHYAVFKEIHCDCPEGRRRARGHRDPACP
jgi:hypothetical protein